MPTMNQLAHSLITDYLASTLSASDVSDALRVSYTDALPILATLSRDYTSAPCDAEGASNAQLAVMDAICARAVDALVALPIV